MVDTNTTGFIRPPQKEAQGNPLKAMPGLFEAALNEFSQKAYDNASLNDILKSGGISKGSFYHKFQDKLDLYLCMFDILGENKLKFFAQRFNEGMVAGDFFQQLGAIIKLGLEYSLQEPRYFSLWRHFINEKGKVKDAVRSAFPVANREDFSPMIIKARENNEFAQEYSPEFIEGIVKLIMYNMDSLITSNLKEKEIQEVIDSLVLLLRRGLANNS